jgi:hypothetical protein
VLGLIGGLGGSVGGVDGLGGRVPSCRPPLGEDGGVGIEDERDLSVEGLVVGGIDFARSCSFIPSDGDSPVPVVLTLELERPRPTMPLSGVTEVELLTDPFCIPITEP